MTRSPYEDDEALAFADFEDFERVIEEMRAMGVIVDSGRRRNGRIVWITREQAERERLKLN
jgi:hypothetical protein